jgi:hypothetical protein
MAKTTTQQLDQILEKLDKIDAELQSERQRQRAQERLTVRLITIAMRMLNDVSDNSRYIIQTARDIEQTRRDVATLTAETLRAAKETERRTAEILVELRKN